MNEGALNNIFKIYKQLLPKMGGHLVEAGRLIPHRLEVLLAELAVLEEDVLQQRAEVLPLSSEHVPLTRHDDVSDRQLHRPLSRRGCTHSNSMAA